MSGVHPAHPSECEGAFATCAHCQALEARVAELESKLAVATARSAADGSVTLEAFRLQTRGWAEGWGLRPSPARRQWMTETPFSYQCLPLVIANQWGWQVLCPTDAVITWDGTPGLEGLLVEVYPQYADAILSRFGSGIVTFSLPWLFRTPPGWNLLAKGPSNRWKSNCVPLEGVIETWWLNYPFTMNWKLVEPGTVVFRRGESVAQLVPVPHATFEGSSALERPIEAAGPETIASMNRWAEERRRLADEPVKVHRFYRRAEEVEEHLVKVPVPPVMPAAD